MRFFLTAVLAVATAFAARAQGPASDDLDLVPANAWAFAHVRAADIWKTPAFKVYRDLFEKSGKDTLAKLDALVSPPLSSIDRVTLVVLPPLQAKSEPQLAIFVRTSRSFDFEKLVAGLKSDKDVYLLPKSGIVKLIDKQTILFGSDGVVEALVRGAGVKGVSPLTAALKEAAGGKYAAIASANIAAFATPEMSRDVPPPAQPFLRAKTATLTANFNAAAEIKVAFVFRTGDDAKEAEQTLNDLRETGKAFLGQAKREMERKLAAAQPAAVFDFERVAEAAAPVAALGIIRRGEELLAQIPIQRNDVDLSFAIKTPEELRDYGASAPAILTALLVPAVQKVREAASRVQDANNLKQLALAFHMHYDVYKSFPKAAICDKAGKPLLSWRVAVLPFVEQEALYRQFKLDEPWDSEHNKKLIPLMPKVFERTSGPTESGMTFYRVFVGGDDKTSALYKSYAETLKFQNITDGTSNTILIADAETAVPWTKPEELAFDAKGPLPRLNQTRRGRNVAMCDGSVHFLSDAVNEQTLRAMITRNGGEVIPFDD